MLKPRIKNINKQEVNLMDSKIKTCLVPDCKNKALSKGYCPKHYQQIRKHGRLTPEKERLSNIEKDCLASWK